jgi:hypothetical protein
MGGVSGEAGTGPCPFDGWTEEANRALRLAACCVPDGSVLRTDLLIAAIVEVAGLETDLPDVVDALPPLWPLRSDPPEDLQAAERAAAVIADLSPEGRKRFLVGADPSEVTLDGLLLALTGEPGPPGDGSEYGRLSADHVDTIRCVAREQLAAATRLRLAGSWDWFGSRGGVVVRLIAEPPGGIRRLELRADGSAAIHDGEDRESQWEVHVDHVEHFGTTAVLLSVSETPVAGVLTLWGEGMFDVRAPFFDSIVHTYLRSRPPRHREDASDAGRWRRV